MVAVSCKVNVLFTPPAEAVRVTLWAVLTAEAVAVNEALVDPPATVTEEGTETALLLLARETVSPELLAADVSVTVHVSVAAPVMELLLQLRPLRLPLFFNFPWPVRCIFLGPPCLLLVVKVSVPLAVPVEVGEKATPIDEDWLGASVKGRLVWPDRLKPVPETATSVTVIEVELLFVTCTWLVLVCPTTTLPKSTLAGAVNEEELLFDRGAPHPAIRRIIRLSTAGSRHG